MIRSFEPERPWQCHKGEKEIRSQLTMAEVIVCLRKSPKICVWLGLPLQMRSPQLGSFPLPVPCLTLHPPTNRLEQQSMSHGHPHNHEHQEPDIEQNQQEQFNCHELLLLLSPTVSWISHQLPTRQSCCPFIGNQCEQSLKHDFSESQLADWRIAAHDLQTSIPMVILS